MVFIREDEHAMMIYCTKCLLPNTKPDLKFIEGVCTACLNFEKRREINWMSREKEFVNIIKTRKNSPLGGWDCLIPVSGGKDSTYQVIKILELGFNPLCVTSSTCDLSEIGRANIENIKNLGVDCIEFSPKKSIRKKLNRIGLRLVGDISWPEHVGIFTIPVSIATKFNIPTIIWGENSQNEYGSPDEDSSSNFKLDRRWLEEFGGLIGLRVNDLVGIDEIRQEDLLPYYYPTIEQLENGNGVLGLFLGHYFPWNGFNNYLVAQMNGFKSLGSVVEGSIVDYENLDNYQTGIHDYFKYLKFGFGRATDIASIFIRRGILSRENAITIVKKLEGAFPLSYLGKSTQDILNDINIDMVEFESICDKFTNKELFLTDKNGNLVKDKSGNLTKKDFHK
jgi:N-acetyl sugar amidotransferase